MFMFLFLSANMVFNGLAMDEEVGMDDFGENIVEHDEKMLASFRIEDSTKNNNIRDNLQKTDDVMPSEKVSDFRMIADNVVDENNEDINLINTKMTEGGDSIPNKETSSYNEESSGFEKSADYDDLLGENIEEMNLDNIMMTEKDDDDENIFSNMKESAMAVFDEEVLEEELSEASVKPSHTPWSLVGMSVGGGVLVVVVVVGVLAGVMLWRSKKTKKVKIDTQPDKNLV